jgi:Bacterial regulatory helix-turn-helix protein, lysR family
MSKNDTKLMESVIALAEELHFGRAARRLRISQPMLTKNIQDVEALPSASSPVHPMRALSSLGYSRNRQLGSLYLNRWHTLEIRLMAAASSATPIKRMKKRGQGSHRGAPCMISRARNAPSRRRQLARPRGWGPTQTVTRSPG